MNSETLGATDMLYILYADFTLNFIHRIKKESRAVNLRKELSPDSIKKMSISTNVDELISVTKDLADVVSELCQQIKLLMEERLELSTGSDMRDAYTLVIRNKIWTVERLIGTYWKHTLKLDLDKEESDAKEVSGSTASTPSGGENGPTGCEVKVIELGGENGPFG